MKTIYKYPLVAGDRFTLQLPAMANILTVQNQRGEPCIWAVIDTTEPIEQREFVLYGTGHEIPEAISEQMDYIGTFQLDSGTLVFHLFELLND